MPDAKQIDTKMNKLIAEKRFTEMLTRADEVMDEYPDNYLGYWWKARTYTLMSDTEAALHWFMEAIKRAENEHEESKISSSMANVYNIRKDWDNSLNYTEIALDLNPANVVAIIARSIALTAKGKKREAYQLLDSNTRLYKDEYQKACVAAVKKNKEKMLMHLRNAIKENPHTRITVLYDPDFALYRNTPELRMLLKV